MGTSLLLTRNTSHPFSMYTSSTNLSTLMKIVGIIVVICCIVATSKGVEITDDIDTNDFDRYLRSSVSHFLRGGRAPSGTSHFLRGRRSYGLVNAWLTNNGNEDIEEEDEDPIYQRGVRNSVSHFLRGRRASSTNHFLRGRKAGVVNHFLRGRKSGVNHFLRGKKSLPEENQSFEGVAYEEEPSTANQMDDTLY